MPQYTCPVCAYSQMPYDAEEGNICPCCGTEFGYDDTMGVTFRQLRDRWVTNNTPWFSPIDTPPAMWNGVGQLILADFDFTWPGELPEPLQTEHVAMPGTRVDVLLELSAAAA